MDHGKNFQLNRFESWVFNNCRFLVKAPSMIKLGEFISPLKHDSLINNLASRNNNSLENLTFNKNSLLNILPTIKNPDIIKPEKTLKLAATSRNIIEKFN